MANDIDLYSDAGGGLAPYSPSQPLAPAPDFGTELSNREIDEYTQYTGGGQHILGQPLPPGVSIAQVTQAYKELGNVFTSDFIKLGHDTSQTQKAVTWFMDALKNPPAQQRQRHTYNLFEHKNDPIFQAFADFAHDHNFPAKFVQDACWWVSEAGRKLAQRAQTKDGNTPPRMAPSSDPTEQLTDQQYNQLVAHNNAVQARTLATLEQRWGQCFKVNIELAQAQLSKMTPAELAHLDRWTGAWPWTHMFNTVECLGALYDMAVGANSIPKDGASIANEIASFEAMLKIPSERQKYMRDPQMQARLRELYARRGN